MHEGAAYLIEVPARWNGEPVVFAHGYEGEGTGPGGVRVDPSGNYLTEQGYAWAASGYRIIGYRPDWFMADTLALRERFIKEFGRPRCSTPRGPTSTHSSLAPGSSRSTTARVTLKGLDSRRRHLHPLGDSPRFSGGHPSGLDRRSAQRVGAWGSSPRPRREDPHAARPGVKPVREPDAGKLHVAPFTPPTRRFPLAVLSRAFPRSLDELLLFVGRVPRAVGHAPPARS